MGRACGEIADPLEPAHRPFIVMVATRDKPGHRLRATVRLGADACCTGRFKPRSQPAAPPGRTAIAGNAGFPCPWLATAAISIVGPRRKPILRLARSAWIAGAATAAAPMGLPGRCPGKLRAPPWSFVDSVVTMRWQKRPSFIAMARWLCPDQCNRQGETHGAADLIPCRAARFGANAWIDRRVKRRDARIHKS
jgi:hypothetical protein